MVETFVIDHIGHRGDGVAFADGCAIYVPHTLPGERVETDSDASHPDRRRLRAILEPSSERTAPFCDYFGSCGGCATQHWQVEPYRRWKRGLVVDALVLAGVACEVEDLIDAHGDGRRRAIFHARRGRDGEIKVGFAEQASHSIVPIQQCPVLSPSMAGAIDAAETIASVLSPTNKPLDIQVVAADNGLDIDVRGSGPLDAAMRSALSSAASCHGALRITRHRELVVMRAPPVVTIGNATVMLPPGSFMQPTVAGEHALASQVLARTKRAKHIADLFCGIGPFALRMSETARVTGYDSDQSAILALTNAAKGTQGLKPVSAASRDLFRRPLVPQELRDHDAVVFDPPRQGAQAQVEQLAKSKVPLVVAVSCNPATFARDARILIDGGYSLSDVVPVDQFKYTPHVEIAATFRR